MKMILATLFTTLALSTQVKAELKPGTYHGETASGIDAKIFVTAFPGRKGSYYGLITTDEANAVLYRIDEYSNGKYGLIPQIAYAHGPGTPNINPSLSMNEITEDGEKFIEVVSNQTSNMLGFKEGMKFSLKNKSDDLALMDYSITGSYAFRDQDKAASVSRENSRGEANITLNLGSLKGDFVIRMMGPGIYSLYPVVTTSTGIQVKKAKAYLAYFFYEPHLLGSCEYFVLVNTTNNRVYTLKRD